MKRSTMKIAGFVFMLIGLFAITTAGQMMTKTIELSDGDQPFIIREFGGMISTGEDGYRVDMVLPSDARADEYKTLDVQAGDVIKMVNGKKFDSIEEFNKYYEDLTVGDEIMLGVVRDKKMMIKKFTKGDPEKMPARMQVRTITDESDLGFTALIDLGFILSENDNIVQISQIVDGPGVLESSYMPVMGDFLRKFQGKDVKSMQEVADLYKAVKVGDQIDMVVESSGQKHDVSIIKPQPRKKIMQTITK